MKCDQTTFPIQVSDEVRPFGRGLTLHAVEGLLRV